VDQARVEAAQGFVVEALPLAVGQGDGFDQNVGTGHQFPEDVSRGRIFSVEHQRALVGVEVEVAESSPGAREIIHEGAAPAQGGALGSLDEDDLRAQVSQQAPGQRGRCVGQIENANAR